jgi:amidase
VPSTGVFASAHELLEGLRSGRLTSEALVTSAIARARDINPRFNPVVALDEAGALARARAADEATRAGRPSGPLHGLPMTVKDCFEVAGLPAVNGAPELVDYRPARHAPAVQRLVDAGAIVIGKTNVPLYSLDLQTFNDVFGVTRNPWNPERTPGGSSGGAAVALATGITSLELGSDLAGSLRNPAHSTGVCSLKPSSGVVPTGGVLAPGPGRLRTPDLIVAGPLARSVADLELMLGILAGPCGRDAAAWRLALPLPRAPGRELRVAAWLDDAICPVETGVAEVLERACRGIEATGPGVDRSARPPFDAMAYFRDFFLLLYGEISAGLPESVFRSFSGAARRGTGDAPWTPLTVMPSAVAQTHRDWLAASERREGYRADWDEFFKRFDVLLTPVSPATAFPHDHRPFEGRSITLRGRDYAYMQQSFWCALATTSCLPAAVVPVGLAGNGMPVGLQIIGPYLGDYTTLEFAKLVERVTGGFRPPPP